MRQWKNKLGRPSRPRRSKSAGNLLCGGPRFFLCFSSVSPERAGARGVAMTPPIVNSLSHPGAWGRGVSCSANELRPRVSPRRMGARGRGFESHPAQTCLALARGGEGFFVTNTTRHHAVSHWHAGARGAAAGDSGLALARGGEGIVPETPAGMGARGWLIFTGGGGGLSRCRQDRLSRYFCTISQSAMLGRKRLTSLSSDRKPSLNASIA